jgi:hypothetical protein
VRFAGTPAELAGNAGFARALHDLLVRDDRPVEDDIDDAP